MRSICCPQYGVCLKHRLFVRCSLCLLFTVLCPCFMSSNGEFDPPPMHVSEHSYPAVRIGVEVTETTRSMSIKSLSRACCRWHQCMSKHVQVCLLRYYETYPERVVMSSPWKRGLPNLYKLQCVFGCSWWFCLFLWWWWLWRHESILILRIIIINILILY
jgi:hypothetical protein